MANSENQIFTFSWRIDNWNMHPGTGSIKSPPFVVEFLENTEWSIILYSYLLENQPFVRAVLKRANKRECTQDIIITYSLALHTTHDDREFEINMTGEKFGPGDMSDNEVSYHFEPAFFSNDTMRVRCQINRCMDEIHAQDVSSRFFWGNNWNPKDEKCECSARSLVRVSSKSFVWPIKRIGELLENVKLSTSLPSVTKIQVSIGFSLYLKKDPKEGERICIEIHTKNVDKPYRQICAQCRIKTIGAPKNVQFQGEDQRYFCPGRDDWLFPNFLKMKDLTESYLNHTGGTLYLQIEISFCTGKVVHTEFLERFPLDVEQREISHASTNVFGELYGDREHSDVTLRVGDQEIKAHKKILITGSDVFRQIFESEMKQESGIVDIDDLDPDTVDLMLKYMYTDEVEKLYSKDAIKLYYAADKYNIGSLKGRLRPQLIANLSLRTVYETLVLADKDKDEDLLDSIVDYVHRNSTEIFRSDMWDCLADCHGSLAAKTMIQVLTRKSLF